MQSHSLFVILKSSANLKKNLIILKAINRELDKKNY
jgi:hypothetical protein